MIEIKVGANSKIMDWRVANPIKFLGKKGFSKLRAVCMDTTPPTKKEMKETIPKDPIMRESISFKISCLRIFHLVNFPNTRWSMIKYFPILERTFIPFQR
jgi:hypothetical protein